MVDTLPLLLVVVVHAADARDREGAKRVLENLVGRFPRLWLLWADGGDAGTLLVWALVTGRWEIDLVKKPEGGQPSRHCRSAGSSSAPSPGSGAAVG